MSSTGPTSRKATSTPASSVELSTALWSVLEAARTNDLTAYDAAYLDLALVRGLPLATVDTRLRTACADMGVQLVA